MMQIREKQTEQLEEAASKGLKLGELSRRSGKGDSRHCGGQSTDRPASILENTVGFGLEL